MDLDAARVALAAAVTAAGRECLPYEPDNPQPPIAFVDSLDLGFAAPTSVWRPATATATILSCDLRNDRPASVAGLESSAGPVIDALQSIPGLRVVGVRSGTAEVGKVALPAVIYTVEFSIER